MSGIKKVSSAPALSMKISFSGHGSRGWATHSNLRRACKGGGWECPRQRWLHSSGGKRSNEDWNRRRGSLGRLNLSTLALSKAISGESVSPAAIARLSNREKPHDVVSELEQEGIYFGQFVSSTSVNNAETNGTTDQPRDNCQGLLRENEQIFAGCLDKYLQNALTTSTHPRYPALEEALPRYARATGLTGRPPWPDPNSAPRP